MRAILITILITAISHSAAAVDLKGIASDEFAADDDTLWVRFTEPIELHGGIELNDTVRDTLYSRRVFRVSSGNVPELSFTTDFELRTVAGNKLWIAALGTHNVRGGRVGDKDLGATHRMDDFNAESFTVEKLYDREAIWDGFRWAASFTIDDGLDSTAVYGDAALELGQNVTGYCIINNVGDSGYLDWDDWEDFVQDGHEAGMHQYDTGWLATSWKGNLVVLRPTGQDGTSSINDERYPGTSNDWSNVDDVVFDGDHSYTGEYTNTFGHLKMNYTVPDTTNYGTIDSIRVVSYVRLALKDAEDKYDINYDWVHRIIWDSGNYDGTTWHSSGHNWTKKVDTFTALGANPLYWTQLDEMDVGPRLGGHTLSATMSFRVGMCYIEVFHDGMNKIETWAQADSIYAWYFQEPKFFMEHMLQPADINYQCFGASMPRNYTNAWVRAQMKATGMLYARGGVRSTTPSYILGDHDAHDGYPTWQNLESQRYELTQLISPALVYGSGYSHQTTTAWGTDEVDSAVTARLDTWCSLYTESKYGETLERGNAWFIFNIHDEVSAEQFKSAMRAVMKHSCDGGVTKSTKVGTMAEIVKIWLRSRRQWEMYD